MDKFECRILVSKLACGRVFRGGLSERFVYKPTSFLLSNWVKKHVSLFIQFVSTMHRCHWGNILFPKPRLQHKQRTMMVLSGRDDERHLVLENYHRPPRPHSHWALNGVCLLWEGMYTKWEFGCNSVEPDPAFSNNVYSVVKFFKLLVVCCVWKFQQFVNERTNF